MAIYAIGDVHGCSVALKTLLNTIPVSSSDTLVFLGDYIDRGFDSKGVIDQILDASERYQVITLRGNHEIMMLDARLDEPGYVSTKEWLFFGGEETLASYNTNGAEEWRNKVPVNHWEFLKRTKSYYEAGPYIFVHAGLERGIPLNEQSETSLFWKHPREPENYADDKLLICGHTSQKNGEIRKYNNTVFIDTYAYGGKWLSCLDVTSGLYWQANESGETNTGKINLLE